MTNRIELLEHILGTWQDVVCMGTMSSVTRQYSDKYTQTTDIYIITYTASTPTYTIFLLGKCWKQKKFGHICYVEVVRSNDYVWI